MGTTPSYGWAYPDPTDLVKDLPADFELFADAVDADLADLLGGANGAVLSKASASDHDFAWVAPSGLIQIATGTFSGSAVNITSIPGTYKQLMLTTAEVTTSSTGQSIRMRFNGDNAANYYDGGSTLTGSNEVFNDNEVAFMAYGTGTSRGQSTTFIRNYAVANVWKSVWSEYMVNNSTTTANVDWRVRIGAWNNTGAITELNLSPASGTFSSGTYTLYGVN